MRGRRGRPVPTIAGLARPGYSIRLYFATAVRSRHTSLHTHGWRAPARGAAAVPARGPPAQLAEGDALGDGAAEPDDDGETDPLGTAEGTGATGTEGDGGRHCGSGFVRSPSCSKKR